MRVKRLLLAALFAAPIGGCGGSEAPPPPVVLKPLSAAVGTATVHGRITFVGTRPVMKTFDAKCYPGADPIKDQSALVDSEGGLANVFVSLEGGPAVSGASLPPKLLDQENCTYKPHVIGVVVRQTLKISSDDPVFHNVHYDPLKNPAANLTFASKGQTRTTSFETPEIFHARCDVHPWMSGWIGVFANPLFTVTGTGGGFSIRNVPAGKYTLVAWHERYGEVRRPVEVGEGGTVNMDLQYAPPGKGTS